MRSPSRSVRNRPEWRRPNRLVAPPGGGGPESVILRRPRSRLTAEVDLYGGTAAAARIVPGTARWPEHETVDRLIVSVSFAALTLLSTTRDLMPRIRHRIMGIAAALVEEPPDQDRGESWSECVASRRLVHPTNPGQPRIVARLVETPHRAPAHCGRHAADLAGPGRGCRNARRSGSPRDDDGCPPFRRAVHGGRADLVSATRSTLLAACSGPASRVTHTRSHAWRRPAGRYPRHSRSPPRPTGTPRRDGLCGSCGGPLRPTGLSGIVSIKRRRSVLASGRVSALRGETCEDCGRTEPFAERPERLFSDLRREDDL